MWNVEERRRQRTCPRRSDRQSSVRIRPTSRVTPVGILDRLTDRPLTRQWLPPSGDYLIDEINSLVDAQPSTSYHNDNFERDPTSISVRCDFRLGLEAIPQAALTKKFADDRDERGPLPIVSSLFLATAGRTRSASPRVASRR